MWTSSAPRVESSISEDNPRICQIVMIINSTKMIQSEIIIRPNLKAFKALVTISIIIEI